MHLRLLSYNVHKCRGGLDRRLNPARIAQAIAHVAPDIAILQEVGTPSGRTWPKAGRHPRRRAGLSAPRVRRARDPPRRRPLRQRHLESRYPIAETRYVDLSVPFKKKRGALHARIRVRSTAGRVRTLHVYNLHLGLSGDGAQWAQAAGGS